LKKLDFFVFKSYIGPLILTFFIALFVLLMQFLWKYVDDFVGKGFELSVIAELMFYASATFVPMALPLAVLLSSLMLFGNLGENYELAAIKSAGISLNRTFLPLMITAMLLTGIAFYFANNVLPVANLKFRTLLGDVRQQKPAVQIEAGVFYSEIDNYVIRFGEKDPDGVSIKDVMIYDHRAGNGNTNVTIAKSGKMEMSADKRFLVFTLNDGYNYDENIKRQQRMGGNTMPMQRTQFEKMIRRLDLSAFDFKKSSEGIRRNHYQMMNIDQLMYFKDSINHQLDSSLQEYRQYMRDDYGFLNLYVKTEADSSYQEEQRQKIHPDSLPVSPENPSVKSNLGMLRASAKKASVAEAPKNLRFSDTLKINEDTFLRSFPYSDAIRIANVALVGARNASFRSEIVDNNKVAKQRLMARYNMELHRKIALSLACFLFFFIGAPLGAIIRKGGLGTPLVISVLLFVTYYVFSMIGEKSAKELALSPFAGMWLSTFVFAPIGIFLTYKSTADAPLLDREFYIKFYEKINRKLPFKRK
jgi:lipopolysaccharide export system permease protein